MSATTEISNDVAWAQETRERILANQPDLRKAFQTAVDIKFENRLRDVVEQDEKIDWDKVLTVVNERLRCLEVWK